MFIDLLARGLGNSRIYNELQLVGAFRNGKLAVLARKGYSPQKVLFVDSSGAIRNIRTLPDSLHAASGFNGRNFSWRFMPGGQLVLLNHPNIYSGQSPRKVIYTRV